MATVTAYGLGQEGAVHIKLCTANTEVLAPRGITSEFLTGYTAKLSDMEKKAAAASLAKEGTGVLTERESGKRGSVMSGIRKVNDIVKATYPKGGAIWKAFHIGDQPINSTKVILRWANDCLEAAEEHKAELLANGLLQSDIDDLKSDAAQLKATDTDQETSKKSSKPAAFKEYRTAMDDVETMSDKIISIASAAFKKDPDTLKQFKAAKKLRYMPAPRKQKTPAAEVKTGEAAPAAK
jgi:hypothetical protein